MLKKYGKWAIGVIAGGFIWEYIAKPIIGLAGSFSGTFGNVFSNYFYKQCATANMDDIILFMFSFFVIPILAVAIIISIIEFKATHEDLNTINQLDKKAEVLSNVVSGETNVIPDIKVEDETANIEKIKKNIGKLKKTSKKSLFRKIITVVFQIMVIINLIAFTILPNAVKLVFDNAVVKITPYVSEVEINKLKSDWMRMESEKDFVKIDEFIDTIMESENYKERQVYEND